MLRYISLVILGVCIMGCCGGKCKTPVLPAPTQTIVSENTVALKIVSSSDYKNGEKIVLQFSADWCGPCRILKQTIKNSPDIQSYFKEETRGYFVIDIESDDPIHQAWTEIVKPASIPLVIEFYYQDGTWIESKRFEGSKSASDILKWLKGE